MRGSRFARVHAVLMLLLLIGLAGCQALDTMAAQTPTLPGKLIVVASAEPDAPASVYVSGEGFRRLSPGQSEVANRQRDEYAPANTSPDGKWQVALAGEQTHFVVASAEHTYAIPQDLVFTRGYAWSPDSRYFAFAGDDRGGKWTGRVFVLDLQGGAIMWIGDGIMPSWTD